MDSLCDELPKHECEDTVDVDYFFDTVNVEGRLKDHIQFWVNIQAPDFILSVISEGYKLQNQFSIYLLRAEYQKILKIVFTLSIRCPFPLSLLVNVVSS